MKKHRLLILFVCLSLAYALIVLLGPTDKATLAKYHMSQTGSHLLSLTVVVPLVLIWLSAFYGFTLFRNYARLIHNTAEGPAFDQISHGLGLLAFSLPISSIMTSTVSLVDIQHSSYFIPLTIIKNYLILILPLFAFVTISRGAEKLTLLAKRKKIRSYSPGIWALGIIFFSSLFSWLIIARPADSRGALDVYHLPSWLIITTIVVPYLYTWFRGVLGAYYISSYQLNVKGKLYRESLRYLSTGVLTVIVINIVVQSVTTLSNRLYRLQLTPMLIIIYVLIAMYAVGFGLIAVGAKRLRRIEEV